MKIIYTCSKTTLLVFYLLLVILVLLASLSFSLETSPKRSALNEQERQAFLREISIDGVGEPVDIRSITIPWHFNDTYRQYNEIQKKGGFDLTEFSGKQLQQYTYEYKKYLIHIIIYNGEVVGGDITDSEYKGKVFPLTAEIKNELNAS